MEIITVFLLNVVGIVVFYVIFGLSASRYRKRTKEAYQRLKDTSVDKQLAERFAERASESASKTQGAYWLSVTILLGLLLAGASVYTTSVEPRAHIEEWVTIYAMMYGIGFVGCLIVLSFAVTRYVQVVRLNKFLDIELATHPSSSVIMDAKSLIRLRVSELGLSALSLSAIAGSILLGAGYLFVLFSAAQAAIECARSSKCL